MAEAGQFLEKGSPKLDIFKKFIRKISNFGSKYAKKLLSKLENDRSRDTKKYCP